MFAGGGGGDGARPAGPVLLAPPVGKKLHPGFRLEVAQALIALGLVLEFEVADEQTACIIPMSIQQQEAIVKELIRVAWPGSEETPERFGERVNMWEGLSQAGARYTTPSAPNHRMSRLTRIQQGGGPAISRVGKRFQGGS